MDGTNRKSITLSVRLLRKGRTEDSALRDDHELDESPSELGRLFLGQSEALPPTWYNFVGGFARDPLPRLVNQSCAAVLFVKTKTDHRSDDTRILALTFGTAHHALDPDAFERNFGLRVVLNAVARSNLRNLDVATLDATTFLKRIQASRDADLQGFGIDIDRDLLRLAAGSPKDAAFARSVAGKDALTLHTKVSPSEVLAKCKQALSLYKATNYKKDFGFIDYIAPVREQDVVDELDDIAFKELQKLVKGDASDLHLTLPDILGPEEGREIGYFGIGFKPGSKETFGEVAIEDYVAELQKGKISDIADMTALRASHEVRVIVDGEGDKKQKRKLYDCFVYELEHKGNVYVLFGGDWFAVERKFYREVEKAFARLVSKAPFVASTKKKSERAFIKELDANKSLLNMDQVKLSPTGAAGANLEPCDFLSKSRQFIHLKDGHGSAPISHLWNQGVVSAESFVRDQQFRVALRQAVQDRQKKYKKVGFDALIPARGAKPSPSRYSVVFGIMRVRYKNSGKISLPFFSKVSIKPIADQIQLMGFAVEVHLVERV
jgi:uncharacterized protein (TIGR04141 family)